MKSAAARQAKRAEPSATVLDSMVAGVGVDSEATWYSSVGTKIYSRLGCGVVRCVY